MSCARLVWELRVQTLTKRTLRGMLEVLHTVAGTATG